MYELGPDEKRRLDRDFTCHPPKEDQVPRYNKIREEAGNFAWMLMTICPPTRERSLAMTALEEAVMWANASIARNE